MKSKHWYSIVMFIVCFAGVAFFATPIGDGDELTDQIREIIRTIVDIEPDRITVTVEDAFVRLDGTVESKEQITKIIEAVEPVIGQRELRHELKIDHASVDEKSTRPGEAQE